MQRYTRSLRSVLLLICAALAAASNPGQPRACVNDGSEEGGAPRRSHPGGHSPAGYIQPDNLRTLLHPPLFDKARALQQVKDYEAQGLATLPMVDRQRYGIALIELGEFERARDHWIKLEAEHPGQYATAANLGTAYELTGDNANALKWIDEGIVRNPDSHSGTEWLHSRILAAKLALQSDPAWLEHNRVLGLDFGDEPRPSGSHGWGSGNSGRALAPTELADALTYQLGERTKFIRTPEPVVAQLLGDLGDVLLAGNAPEAALVAYERAKEYGAQSEVLASRMNYASAQLRRRQFAGVSEWLPYAGLAAALLALVGFLAVRQRRAASISAG
jgi:tetratricopeptide (TPR) repeat protein